MFLPFLRCIAANAFFVNCLLSSSGIAWLGEYLPTTSLGQYGPKPSLHFYLKSFRPLPRPTELTRQVGTTNLECEVAAVPSTPALSMPGTYLPCLLFVQGLDSIRVRSQFPIFYPSFQINIFSLTALRLTIAPGQHLSLLTD